MLETLNRYSHGLASIPILHALRERGCLARLAQTIPVSAEQLAREFSANRAYLDVALRMLVCLDWIRPSADGRYNATPGLASSNVIPEQIMDLFHFPFDRYVQGGTGESLDPWLVRLERRWNSEHPYLPDYLDGLLIVPLLLALRAQGRLSITGDKEGGAFAATLRLNVGRAISREIERLFVAKGWAVRSADGLRLHRAGRFVIDRIPVTAVTASYRPMFARAQELLFGEADGVFALDLAGHETHVERTLNVTASGFQHEKYFAALSQFVVRSFDHDDFPSQPKYIVDMGCGDGSLLRRLYETVRDQTRRGKALDAHPLIPIAVDLNEKALAEASRTLAGIEHIALRGDIGDPLALVDTLRAHGVEDLDRVLHVRSFLDHDRPYRQPEDCEAAERRAQFGGGGIYIDAQGRAVAPEQVIQSTVEHLERWSTLVNGHGLILLEVHCLSAEVNARYLDESEGFHFDACHTLSHQYLLEAQTFLACAAEAGLFCGEGRWRRFPKTLPFTRISLSHFEKRPYSVRHAHRDDLPALLSLQKGWPPSQAHDRVAVESRLSGFPEGQFVLQSAGQIMAVVYCDRKPPGAVQLISTYVQPAAPASYVQELLRFVEQYWALKADISHVQGIEECLAAMSTQDSGQSLGRAVAADVAAKVADYPFAAEDDPRTAERELGEFSFRWLLANLQQMGVMRDAGEDYDLDSLERRLGVVAKYHRYFHALIRRLHDEGLVTLRDRRVATTLLVHDYALTSIAEQVAEFKQRVQQRYPASVGLMNLTACCLECYEDIITGRIDITDVLFQNAKMDVFTDVFCGDVVSDFFNRIVADAVHSALTRLKATAVNVRILEIGAGTGATTAAILEVLQSFPGVAEFCFSDISMSFIRHARQRFSKRHPSIEYRLLNIEEDLSRQGFETHCFDIIVAANVLHDTRDIDFTLEQTRRLLKPGGLLILNEYTSIKDCLFSSGALLHGYWLFQDTERRLKDSCLLGVSQWMKVLERSGFAVIGSHALPTQSLDARCSQSVMLCEAVTASVTGDPRERVQVAEGTDHDMASRKAEILGALVAEQALVLLGEERASAYSPERPLMDMGLDSLDLVELKSLINQRLGVKLSPMFLFEHETPGKMTAALSEMVSNEQLERLLPPGPVSGVESEEGSAPDEEQADAIAIVGVACRFPGGITSAESFWKLLDSGRHGIVSMPEGRWRWPAFIDLVGAHKGIDKGGFLERIDEFDAPFFRTSPMEAKLMDPQQRLLLELSWQAVEDGGHRPSELAGRKIGVFVGACHSDYREVLITASDSAEAHAGTGSSCSMLANRLSYFYDFKGPSLTVDTACSSSLFALQHAVTAIRCGDCEQALVGAANLLCSPTNSISYYRAGMLSPTGMCRTFDEKADGYVRGEGGAMLLLKPLAMALAEGDSIYGLVKGTAVNHGGQAASLTAPKPEAQAAVIEAAWQAADVGLESVGYIETHGTGTRLGDPVEVGGLIEAFRRLSRTRGEAWPSQPYCGLGSVKTNVGHLEGAAGLAGLIKVLMAIRHRSIPATLHFERLNPDIDLAGSPFYIAAQNRVWPSPCDQRGREMPRRAGVSSFGSGGANAHAVIEAYPRSNNDSQANDGQCLIPLSARNNERLFEQAKRLLEFVESGITGVRLADVAYTLQVGREPMEECVAFVVGSKEELMGALHAYVTGNRTIPNCHRGHSEARRAQAATHRGERRQEIGYGDLAKIAELWVKGLEPDWSKLYGETKPRRISLPTYPFAKERYWIETAAGGPVAADKVLHPLLHRNTSDLSEQRYSSMFTGQEFFLTDKVLPWVAYLEMARSAIEQASPTQLGSSILELHNTVWAQPIAVAGSKQVHIALLASDKEEVEYEIYSQEGVHCQGRAVWSHEPAPARLDLEQLKGQMERGQLEPDSVYAPRPGFQAITAIHQGGDQLLAQLRLPAGMEPGHDAYVLHPSLMDSALQACVGLMDGRTRLPYALERLRIVSRCTREMVAWVRSVGGSQAGEVIKLDVDLCDERGNVCVQVQGISWQLTDGVEPAVSPKEIPMGLAEVKRKKPADIVLPAPSMFSSANPVGQPSPSRAAITLSAFRLSPAESSVRLYDDGHGIFSIHIAGPAKEVIADLLQALVRAEQESSLKALLLSGLERGFPGGEREAYNEAVTQGLYRTLVSFPYPVIAVVEGDATGAGLLAAALCDFMVCSEEATYGYTDAQHPVYLTPGEANLFSERFGAVQAQDFLYRAKAATGKQLRAKGWTCPIVPRVEVERYARTLAASLAAKSQTSLGLLKQHLARDLSGLVKALTGAEAGAREDLSDTVGNALVGKLGVADNLVALAGNAQGDGWLLSQLCDGCVSLGCEEKKETSERLVVVPTSIAIRSKVVTATAHPEGIVVVKMEDREAKNMFSEALMEGMTEVFSHIEQTPEYKVVILTGYDSYFASGGTKVSLLAIQAGQMNFTDLKIFQLPLECKLPVIAAMQGHGIGAGWTLGMFADVVLLSKESQYVSPYMNYGFTPGAGATYVLANKMGHDLARESLLTGEPFVGRELKQRGLQLRVLPRAEVYGAAMALARQMAQASRSRLMGLKQQWTGHVHQVLEETYRLELAMHEKTFVGQPDTLAQIHKNFYPEMETSSAVVPPVEEVLDNNVLPAVTASLKTLLANELQMRESDVEENVQFVDLGLDSISGVSWIRKVNEKYHTSIEAAQLYSHATLSQLSRYVKQEAEKHGTLSSPSAPRMPEMPVVKELTSLRSGTASRFVSGAPAPVSSTDAIAVIGMAGQFPQAKNLEEFWQNLAQGRNCITQVPANRWDINAYYQPGEAVAGKSNSQWVGALEDYDRFDPLFFNISPTEAESMDPQQRLFLQACWQSIEDAGYDARVLSGSKCGVFVGCTTGDYHQLSRQHQLSAQGFTGGAMSILAARISYFLNLQGPCISIDTACSSSLVAMAHACDSLRSGASNLALAGGVSVMAGPDLHIMTSQAGMLSPQGKCFTFDQRADGFVPGEGVGVVVLKRLAEAEKDGDMIYAVIQGWGVNQDGRTNGITAPNPESQTRLEQEVYDKYRIDPASIQLIEAHGTGTKLGDPIEVEGLKKAFARYTQNKEYCALGSVKSNIGHCMMAAGIAGAIKLVLALKHKQLPPTINFEQLNEHIGLRDSPFYVNSRLQHWELKGAKRRLAAISSFGFSGTNAHMVLGEYLPPPVVRPPVTKAIIPLSAKTAIQLQQRARDLLDFIRKQAASVDLIEMAYTLQVGREPMEERLGMVVSSVEELAEKLEAYIADKPESKTSIKDR